MIIGISGRAGAGKDTVADYIRDTWGFTKLRFALPIKTMIIDLLSYGGVPLEFSKWDDREWEETPILCGKSPRQLAQSLGTEWGRDLVGEDIWLDIGLQRAKMYDNAVFVDVRFDNEAKAIINAGGYVLKVDRPGYFPTEHQGHKSEKGVSSCFFDHIVYNDGEIIDLLQQVEDTINRWRRSG